MAMTNIEAIQSVPPLKMTEPRYVRHVLVPDTIGSGIFKGSMNIVMYYNKQDKEESGWAVAGWIKESLGRAFSEEPLLSGRLIRRVHEDGNKSNSELEIVSNDSGARLVETKVAMTLQGFLDLKERAKLETQLVFWKNIDDQTPDYSPLFYAQVSNFQCGGYSIGISCSLLVADLVIMEDFLQKWARIHNEMLSENEKQKLPIFYLPNIKANTLFPSNKIASTPSNNNDHQTMIFKAANCNENVVLKQDSTQALAFQCIEEAEFRLDHKMAKEFPLIVKESKNVIKVQSCKKHEIGKSNLGDPEISPLNWEDFGISCVGFSEVNNKPAHVSCWIGSFNDGLVMAIPSTNEDKFGMYNVIVKIPK